MFRRKLITDSKHRNGDRMKSAVIDLSRRRKPPAQLRAVTILGSAPGSGAVVIATWGEPKSSCCRRVSAGAFGLHRPLLLDAPVAPDQQGAGPGDHEQADDEKTNDVEIDAAQPAPESAGPAELLGQQSE